MTSASSPQEATASGRTSDDQTEGLPAGCRDQLAAGTKVIGASDKSYSDWRAHTQADLDYRSGKNTWAKTQGIWADTRGRGDSDVAAFRKAHGSYTKTAKGGCDSVERKDVAPQVAKCLDRFEAMEKTVGAGKKVNDEWARHVTMMKHKDHTNPLVYARQWRSMVDGAAKGQNAYRAAKAAYDKAPACA